MKILIVTPRFSPDIGGVETVVSKQSMALAKLGHDVRIITTTKDEKLVGQEIIGNLKVNRYMGFSPKGAYFISRGLSIAIGEFSTEYEIIHAHNYHALPAMSAFRNRNGARFVINPHYHGGSHSKFRNFLLKPYKFFGRRMISGADAVVCVSESEKKMLERDFILPDTYVNYNAVEIEKLELGRKKNNLCIVGRLEGYKNVDKAILALEKARLLGNRDLILNVVGDGPDRKRLEGIVSERGLSESVVFHGFVSKEEKGTIIGSCSCLLALSSHESFGITIIEAAKHGLRVIASDILPHIELAAILGGGVTLANPKNTEKIAGHIIEKSNMKEAQVFDNLSKFSWEDNINRLLGIYKRVLNNQ